MTKSQTVTISQKMSGTGSIFDIESDCQDIVINFGNTYKYAVCAPAYYNITPTRHKSEHSAIARANRLNGQGYTGIVIIDSNGSQYDVLPGGDLIKI